MRHVRQGGAQYGGQPAGQATLRCGEKLDAAAQRLDRLEVVWTERSVEKAEEVNLVLLRRRLNQPEVPKVGANIKWIREAGREEEYLHAFGDSRGCPWAARRYPSASR